MNAETIERARAEQEVIDELLCAWVYCLEDPESYAWSERITKPRDTTWPEWSEHHRDVIAADLFERVERLAVLVGVTVGQAL